MLLLLLLLPLLLWLAQQVARRRGMLLRPRLAWWELLLRSGGMGWCGLIPRSSSCNLTRLHCL